jgi:2-polyprenyl-3-methyl-5-hydroxy-6-metoxy-1,4-benzoquinol methylase
MKLDNHNKAILEKTQADFALNKVELGFQVSYTWRHDPKHVLFALSRYKFVSKMLDGYDHVLEIGCGDAFCSELVSAQVKKLSLTDNEEINISQINHAKFHDVFLHNFIDSPIQKKYDAIYSLDVLEHIQEEDPFLKNAIQSLSETGLMIIGMPTIESQPYASAISRAGHVNCKSKSALKKLMLTYFHTVLMFSMNDEVVHTGFDQMSHYIFAVCTNKR